MHLEVNIHSSIHNFHAIHWYSNTSETVLFWAFVQKSSSITSRYATRLLYNRLYATRLLTVCMLLDFCITVLLLYNCFWNEAKSQLFCNLFYKGKSKLNYYMLDFFLSKNTDNCWFASSQKYEFLSLFFDLKQKSDFLQREKIPCKTVTLHDPLRNKSCVWNMSLRWLSHFFRKDNKSSSSASYIFIILLTFLSWVYYIFVSVDSGKVRKNHDMHENIVLWYRDFLRWLKRQALSGGKFVHQDAYFPWRLNSSCWPISKLAVKIKTFPLSFSGASWEKTPTHSSDASPQSKRMGRLTGLRNPTSTQSNSCCLDPSGQPYPSSAPVAANVYAVLPSLRTLGRKPCMPLLSCWNPHCDPYLQLFLTCSGPDPGGYINPFVLGFFFCRFSWHSLR